MGQLEKLKELPITQATQHFLNSTHQCAQIQQSTLLDIIQRNQDSRIGKRYQFDQIKDISTFQHHVPISHWDDYSKDVDDMLQDIPNILYSDPTICFIQTSGTTGSMKKIPESTMGNDAKKLITNMRTAIVFEKFPDILEHFYLPLVNKDAFDFTPNGTPIGSASGFTVKNLSNALKKKIAYPLEILEANDQESIDYLIMLFSITKDVRMIAVNNAGRISSLLNLVNQFHHELITDIETGTISKHINLTSELRTILEKYLIPNPTLANKLKQIVKESDDLLPHHYWPSLKVIYTWLSGSVGKYIAQIKSDLHHYPHTITLWDSGYGASEVKINIPITPDTSNGLLANFAAFFEFIPLTDQDDSKPLLAHQLKVNQQYRLIVTTYSGLYRYDMKDIIEVSGFNGTTPIISFVSKTADVGNICGEKISGGQITDLVNHFFSSPPTYYCAIADSKQQKYILALEIDLLDNKTQLATEMDNHLQKTNDVYRAFREQQLLNPLEIRILSKGSYQKLLTAKLQAGVGANQIKLPIIYHDNLPAVITKE